MPPDPKPLPNHALRRLQLFHTGAARRCTELWLYFAEPNYRSGTGVGSEGGENGGTLR